MFGFQFSMGVFFQMKTIEHENCEQKSAVAKFQFGVSWHMPSHGLVNIHQPMLSVRGLVSLFEKDGDFDIYSK